MSPLIRALAVPVAVLAAAAVSVSASAAGASAGSGRIVPGPGWQAPAPAVGQACSTLGVIKKWPVSQRVDQLIVVPTDESTVAALAPSATSKFPYGGLILFGASAPSDLGAQIAAVRGKVPDHLGLLVMTDEEGGEIQRMANLVGSMPWARTMASDWTTTKIAAVAHYIARKMVANGVNVDLAPVLDVDGRNVPPGPTDPDGWRSFSGNPAVVSRDGVAFMQGMERGGVLAVVKHFPGLGGSSSNTDDGPAVTLPWPQIQKVALPPFQAAIASGAQAVMTSNAVVPGLTTVPASISEVATTAVLKNEMGFKGLVITDSLSAGALFDIGDSVPVASVKAIAAGADMVLFNGGTTVQDLAAAAGVSQALVAAVNARTITSVRLDDAVLHVLAAKHLNLC
jgi:beta-N-acetylhexosaminidase